MSDGADILVFETMLDAPPEKVWRALTIPEYRERWLKKPVDAEIDVIASDENKSLTFRWREPGQGVAVDPEESLVTFELTPEANGGTWFRLTHAPVVVPVAANTNERAGPVLMLAA
ncbi:SRPBCC domain-containing protein [Devosia sp. CAU 1758]